MRRREVIAGLGAAAAWPLAAQAQQTPVVGFVSFASRDATLRGSWYRAFHEGLESHGWVSGRNVIIEYRFADDDPTKLAAIARELVSLKPDVIFVPTRPALPIVRDAVRSIPIVFVSLGDPVTEGWVSSLSRPGGNLTGVAGLSPNLAGKRLELLREVVPSLSRVGVLWNPANSAEVLAVQVTQTAAQSLGMSVAVEQASESGELDRAIGSIASANAGAVIVLPDPMFLGNRERLIRLIAGSKLPAIYMESDFVAAGGLLSYGPKFSDLFRRAAGYVDRILRGTKPAEMPVEQPTNFVLAINLRTANALGLTIPPTLLARADEVIE
jgi:putative ABC transport system substrate-binding protein